jgi:hypothetical protein
MSRTSIPIMVRHLRFRAGIPKNNMQASVAPVAVRHGIPGWAG